MWCELTLKKEEEKSVSEPKKDRRTVRSSTVFEEFIGKTVSVHNGKKKDSITIIPEMVGIKLGAFSLTKKLGKSIHNSIHNRKLREKARRKITQKKIRKTTKTPKKKGKGTKKKK